MEFCVVQNLISNPFSRRSIQEKSDIVKNGRPCPLLPNLKTKHKEKNREYIRTFKVSQYENTHWLTGSNTLNKLYCWPCLLFSNDNGVWSKSGFENLNTLTLSITRHEKSANHIKCFLQLNAFGRSRIDHQLDEQKRVSDLLHNEKVKKNRDILKRLVDAVCYLAKQELPLRGHDEAQNSVNRGNYIELLHLISNYDPLLEAHFKDSTVFRGTSSAIQNDLIAAISSVINDKIKTEIETAGFVALIMDETSDIINKSQLSTVLRFIDENNQVQERFLGFTDVSRDRTATALLQHVKRTLEEYKCDKKIVAQTYDGAAVMAGQVSGLNKQVQELYPCATFVHCYSHLLNLTLQQSACNIKECRIFFQTMSGLAAFFSKSTKRTAALQDFVKKKLPTVTPTRWNFSSRLVNTVKEYYDVLLEFFKHVLDVSDEWDSDTILKAQGFLAFLSKFNSRFLVTVFSKIFSFSDVVFNILQTKAFDIDYCARKVEDLAINIQGIREENFESIYDDVVHQMGNVCSDEQASKKRHRMYEEDGHGHSERVSCKCLFFEIVDNILAQIEGRFKSIENFKFFSLLNCDLFEKHSKNFPDSDVKSLEKYYGSFFDIVRLKTELSVMYSSPEFKNKNISDLMQFMHANKVYLGMPEVFKLIKLIVTIPATTSSAERSFSALKRIKTYCRATQGQERLSSLTLISIEKVLLAKVKCEPNFYDLVIEKFVAKNRRIEFVFK